MSDQELVKEEQAPEVEVPAEAEAPVEAEPAVAETAAEAEPAEAASKAEETTDAVAEVAESEPPAESAEPAEATDAVAEVAESETPAESAEPAETADDDTSTIFNLAPRQKLSGKVKNITTFGAFVDLGLPQDGLVHISELARRKVEKVEDVVSVGQEVDVWVKKVDRKRGRISLTMVKPVGRRLRDIAEDDELEGTVTRLESYGAFVDIDSERDGLVHISQITHDYIKHPEEALTVGQTVQVKVLKVNKKKRQVDLSIKALLPPPVVEKVEEKKQGKSPKKEEVAEVVEEEPIPTAMAVAFASLQTKDDSEADDSASGSLSKESSKRKRQQNEIISRTLAATK
ncbi:MAG: S1 RNA-binding domain-containing protein [Chloroflexi bacterium]|nr:MAG: S1 RNA-binding domain-containing protein [Chloroflexota bacterium]